MLPPFLVPHPQGVLVAVQARPGSSKNAVSGIQAEALKIHVTQIPEKGKANRLLCEVLAEFLQVKKSQVEILSGSTSSQKRFLIRNVTCEQLLETLKNSGLER